MSEKNNLLPLFLTGIGMFVLTAGFLSFYQESKIVEASPDTYQIKTGATWESLAFNNGRKMAVKSNGEIWAVYSRSQGGASQIFVAYSIDNGQTWNEEQLTNQTGWKDQKYPSIAIDSADNVHVVWVGMGWGSNPNFLNIQYRQRTSAGWQTQEAVTDKNAQQYTPALAVGSLGNIHLVWGGHGWTSNAVVNIQYRQRTSAGWQTQEAITNQTQYSQEYPVITVDSFNNIHVAWTGTGVSPNPGFQNIFYRKKTAIWETQETPAVTWNATPAFPSIVLDSFNNVHLVWAGEPLGGANHIWTRNIIYRQKIGASWQPQELITDTSRSQENPPSIAIDNAGNIYVVWAGKGWGSNPNKNNVQIRKKTGSVWQTQQGLTNSSADQYNPGLVWANWPVVSNHKTNQLKTGYAFVWVDSNKIMFYKSDDLALDTLSSNLIQKHFRVFQDNGDLNSSRAVADEDNSAGITMGRPFRIRFQTANEGELSASISRRLEFKEDNGVWTQITTNSNNARLVNSAFFTDGAATNSRLTPTGSFVAGQGKDTGSDTAAISLAPGFYTEDEYVLKFEPEAAGKTYQFRITKAGVPLDSYEKIPIINVTCTGAFVGITFDDIFSSQAPDINLGPGTNIIISNDSIDDVITLTSPAGKGDTIWSNLISLTLGNAYTIKIQPKAAIKYDNPTISYGGKNYKITWSGSKIGNMLYGYQAWCNCLDNGDYGWAEKGAVFKNCDTCSGSDCSQALSCSDWPVSSFDCAQDGGAEISYDLNANSCYFNFPDSCNKWENGDSSVSACGYKAGCNSDPFYQTASITCQRTLPEMTFNFTYQGNQGNILGLKAGGITIIDLAWAN